MLVNEKGEILAYRTIMADTLWARLKGMLGYQKMPADTVMVIKPCNQVHMFFMRFSIGAIFLDKQGLVLSKMLLRPWQISFRVQDAQVVIEAATDVLELVQIGDRLIYFNE